LARSLLTLFYRDIEVVGAENVPVRGPVLFVANHGNALIDPALMIAVLPRVPRFLAKHTLWRQPLLRPLLEWAGSIPVYRRSEGGNAAANRATFARCCEELAAGACVALFPEGISHDEPELQPLRTGVARIALESATSAGATDLRIVPVGLLFDEKGRFRSRALVIVGQGFAIDPAIAASGYRDREAVRSLTDHVAQALGAVTVNARSWEEWAWIESAAEIYTRGPRSLPGRTSLARGFAPRHRAAELWARLRECDPVLATVVREQLAAYRGNLSQFGLRDDQVCAFYPHGLVARYTVRRLGFLLVWAPLALAGGLVHWPPYRLVGWIASRVASDPDQPATHKVLAGLVVYPLYWIALATIAGVGWGWPAAAAGAIGLPATAWLALRYFERNASFLREVRAFLRLRRDREFAAQVRREREALVETLRAASERASGRDSA